MSAVIGALRGVLSMDSAAFETGAKRAKATMGTVERRMGVLASKMEGAGRRMALGLTLPMAGAATIAVRSSLKIVDAQAKMAQSLGTTVVSMQVLQRAADLSGVSMGEVQQATIQLTKRLSQAAGGSGAAASALDRLQLSASQLQALPLDQRLEKIQSALADYVPEAERAAVASELFGSRAGLIFTRVDGAALRTAAEDVSRFGVAISEVDADQIELTNDAISRMGLAGRGLANQVTVALAPALQGLSDRVADVATWFNGLSDRTKQFVATGALIAGTVGPAALALGLVLKVTLPLGLAMGGLISTVALAPVRFLAATRSAIALEMALGATSTKAAVAGVAIKGLRRGLGLLRGAIISTGIGVLVVGAGYLAMKFHNLVVATGGWGAALRALGDLASGVWTGITTSAGAIAPGLKAIWSEVRASFVRLMQDLSLRWGNFLWSLSVNLPDTPLFEGLAQSFRDASDDAVDKVFELDLSASRLEATAIRLRQEAAGKLQAGLKVAGAAMGKLKTQMGAANAELDAGDDSADALKDRLDALGDSLDDGAGGGVAGGLKKTGETAKEAATELRGPLTSAVEGVSRAFGDWISGGLRDFKSLWDGIRDAAKRGLSDLASQFAQNQLKLALGISVTGIGGGSGTAAQAAGGLISGGGGGGVLSGLLGGSGLAAGLGGGVQAALGLGQFASAGIFNIGANAAVASAATGAGALVSTIGAALPAIGILLGGVALLSKAFSRKFEHSHLEGTVGTEGFDGRARDFYKGGWFRSDKTVYRDLDADLDAALDQQVTGITTGLLSMSEALGLGADALEEFEGYRFSLKTTGRSQAQIQEAIAEHMAAASDEMAALILGTDDLARSGEGAAETLSRLSTSLLTVNDAMDLLGQTSFDVSLLGADLASDLVDAFGGAEPFSTAITGYFGAFYSEGERSEVMMRRLRDAFEELGVAMPASRAGFRAMVESLDLSTDSGQALYAQLIQLSGAMDEVLPQVAAFTAELAGMADQIGGEIGTRIDGARDMASASQAAAEEWRRAAEGLRGVVADLLGTDLSAASSAQEVAAQRARLEAAFAGVKAGDADAAAGLPDLARDYLRGARDTAGSDLEYRRIAAEVQGQLRRAAGIAELESGNDAVLAGLYRQQIEVLTSLGSFLQLEGLTSEQVAGLSEGVQALAADWDGTVAAFETSLTGLEEAIAAAEAFSYDDLVGALDVAVALDEDAPRWLRKLVAAADDGIRTTLDFIIQRDDLTPADRWIATNALSHHVATLDLVMGQDLTRTTRKLALTAAADLRRRLLLDLGQDLDPETRSLVLTRSANLSRRVNVTLSKGGADTLDRLTHLSDLIGDGKAKGSGRLTFGGGVVLEADDVFADLARSTARLTAPMDRLREMLGALRDAVRADRKAREDQSKIASLQTRGANAMARTGGGQDVVDQFNALRTQYGVGLTGQNSNVTVGARGYITPSFDGYKGGDVSGFWAALKETFGTSIIGDVFQSANAQTTADYERAQRLRAQIRALGGIPAFAQGGAHQGGARIVGERGWEVEHTGPSRIHSHAESVAMLDNRPVVQGLQDLTRHVVAQGQVIRMLVDRIASQVDEWNDLGLPEERS